MTNPSPSYWLNEPQYHQYHTTVNRYLMGQDIEAICLVCHPEAHRPSYGSDDHPVWDGKCMKGHCKCMYGSEGGCGNHHYENDWPKEALPNKDAPKPAESDDAITQANGWIGVPESLPTAETFGNDESPDAQHPKSDPKLDTSPPPTQKLGMSDSELDDVMDLVAKADRYVEQRDSMRAEAKTRIQALIHQAYKKGYQDGRK